MNYEAYIKEATEKYEVILREQLARAEKMKNAAPALDFANMDKIIIGTCGDISLDGQNFYAILALQLFLGVHELLHIAAGDHDVGAFLGVCDGDAVADGACLAVRKHSAAAAGDDNRFSG